MRFSKAITTLVAGIFTSGIFTTAQAAVIHDTSTTVYANGFVAGHIDGTAVGQNGNGNHQAFGVVAFSVDDILADTGLTLATINTTTFDVSFDTVVDVIELPNASTYKVAYLGFFADADTTAGLDLTTAGNESNLGGSFWNNGLASSLPGSPIVDTGVADTLALQTGIEATGFTLSGVTEANSDDDYVVFRISYTSQGAGQHQQLDNFTISAVAVPEPSSVALLGLGGLLIVGRRRRD